MSHIDYVSIYYGFNVSIIAGLFSLVAARLCERRHGAWIAIVGIAAYTLLVGAGPSVVRAAIMGSLALAAHQIECGVAPATALLAGVSGYQRTTGSA